jgi:hypothetical protein
MKRHLIVWFFFAGASLPGAISAAPTFKKDVEPVFKAKCTKCHGLLLQQKGLSLRNLKSAIKGGESGAVIIPGKPRMLRGAT